MSLGIGISSPGLETPGYLQADIILRNSLVSLYITQISPGALRGFFQTSETVICFCLKKVLFVSIAAFVPGAIPCSHLSGFRKIPKIFCLDKPYWRIFTLECSVQKNLPVPRGVLKTGFINFIVGSTGLEPVTFAM